jgi:hypothetical protein
MGALPFDPLTFYPTARASFTRNAIHHVADYEGIATWEIGE